MDRSLYLGIENPMSAFVEGYPLSLVILKTNNGTIRKTSSSRMVYLPARLGRTSFTAYIKGHKTLKKLGEYAFIVKEFPNPVAKVGNLESDITIAEFSAQQGVRSEIPPGILVCTEGIHNSIDSFTIIIMRNREIIFNQTNTDAYFTKEEKQFITTLKKDDKILIVNIASILSNGKHSFLAPLEFTITDKAATLSSISPQ